MRRSREHVLCRAGRCMPHAIRNANGHGMACNGRIPKSAVCKDTVGQILPRRQQLLVSVKILNVSISNKIWVTVAFLESEPVNRPGLTLKR